MLDLSIQILLITLCTAGTFMTLTGLAFWLFIMRANNLPMDESNRVAHLGLVWSALSQPDEFVELYIQNGVINKRIEPDGVFIPNPTYTRAFPELTSDVGDMRRQLMRTRPEPVTAAEAVYGFVAWLTTRDMPVTMSAAHSSSEPCDLMLEFIEAQALGEVTAAYPNNLKAMAS